MADPEAIRRAIERRKGKGSPAPPPEAIEPSGNVRPPETVLAERPDDLGIRPSLPFPSQGAPEGFLRRPQLSFDPRRDPASVRATFATRAFQTGLQPEGISDPRLRGAVSALPPLAQTQLAETGRTPTSALTAEQVRPFPRGREESVFDVFPGLAASFVQGLIPGEQDIERRAKELRRLGFSSMAAATTAFREADLPPGIKLALRAATDPLNLLGIPGGATLARTLARGAARFAVPEGALTGLGAQKGLLTSPFAPRSVTSFPERVLPSRIRTAELGTRVGDSALGAQVELTKAFSRGPRNKLAILEERYAQAIQERLAAEARIPEGQRRLEALLGRYGAEDQLNAVRAAERDAGIALKDAEAAARGRIAKETSAAANLESGRVPPVQSGPVEPPRRPAAEAPTSPPERVPPKTVDVVAPTVDPTPLGEDILGLRSIQVGLSESEGLANVARRTVGRPFGAIPDSEISTPALAERTRARAVVESQSNRLASVSASRLARAFNFDDAARIPSLAGVDPTVPGAPTIQDVAARLPQYNVRLTDEQRAVLAALRDETVPYGRLLRELGEEVPTRADIAPGGFYIPRGRAALEGADEPVKVRAGAQRGGRPGALRPAREESMAAGIEDGYEYASVEDALFAMVADVGNRAVDRHVANFFANVVDPETGVRFASSVADRTDPALRGQVEALRSKVSARLQTIRTQRGRFMAEVEALKDANRLADKADAQYVRAAKVLKGRADRGATDVAFAETERELNVLERVVRRLDRAAGRAEQRTFTTAARGAVTADNIIRMRAELNALKGRWEAAKRTAQATPRDQGIIGIPGLESLTFPDEIANAANKVLRDQGAAFGEGAGLTRIHRAFNNLYRGMRATLDNSAPGIQGLLGLANDQRAWAGALRVNVHAWYDGKALGQFIDDFDQAASVAKRLSSTEWTKHRLRLGGAQTEFRLGGDSGPIGQAVERIPLVRQANRAFGFFGDSLRLGWADDLLKEELRRGRALQEIVSSGDAERIARTVNNMTGWSEGRTFGALGDLLLFAPRFLQSRLETVTKAGLSIRPGAPLDQRIARKSLVKMVGFATVLTVALNEMQGEKTDFRPIVNGRFNSNFMRVRFGGRDWSLMGTWDSLARAIVTTASGKPQDALRGMSSGVVTTAWDLISGDDFIGRSVRDDPADFAKWMLRTITPFAGEELPEAVSQVAKGVTDSDVGSAVAGVTTIGGELSGAKSSPLTPFEQREIVREQTRIKLRDAEPEGSTRFANPYRHPDTGGDEKAAVDAQPEVRAATEKVSKRRRERGSDFQDYVDEQTEINDAFYVEVEKAGVRMASRSAADIGFGGAEFRAELAKDQRSRAGAHARNRKTHQKTLDALSKRDAPTAEFDIARDEYAELFFDPELSDPVTGQYDFSERDSRRVAYVKKHGADMLRRVEDHNRRNEPDILKRLRADRETLKSYWNITPTFMEAYGLTREYENWSLRAKNERNIYIESIVPSSRQKLFRQVLVLAGNEKKLQRENRRAIRDPLLFWGYIDLEVSDVIARQEAVAVGQ